MYRPITWMALLFAGCDSSDIHVIGAPGGVYEPESGCAVEDLAAGGSSCPSGAQVSFESHGDIASVSSDNFSNVRISCRRSFCGTGSLAVRAYFRWARGTPVSESDRLGMVGYRLPRPVDLFGKTVSFRVFVDNFITPMRAQIAVIHRGNFRTVDDSTLLNWDGWNHKGGTIGPENAILNLPDTVTSFEVSEIFLKVYLERPVQNGDTWSGNIYFDEVTWR